MLGATHITGDTRCSGFPARATWPRPCIALERVNYQPVRNGAENYLGCTLTLRLRQRAQEAVLLFICEVDIILSMGYI
jgi:hypothetical protein